MAVPKPPFTHATPPDIGVSSIPAQDVEIPVVPPKTRVLTVVIDDDELRIALDIMERRTSISADVLAIEALQDYVNKWINEKSVV